MAGESSAALTQRYSGKDSAVEGVLPPMIEQPASVIAIRFDHGRLGAILSAVMLIGVLFMDVEKYMPKVRKSPGGKKSNM